MKKCPRCGAGNKPDASACFNCFTSLKGVPVTDAPSAAAHQTSPSPAPAVPQRKPSGPARPVGGPLTAGPLGSWQNQQRDPYGPSPGPFGAEPSHYGRPPQMGYARRGAAPRPKPVKSGSSGAFWILLIILILAGGGFAAWKYIWLPRDPMTTVRTFIKASVAGDEAATRATITEDSQQAFTAFQKVRKAVSGGTGTDIIFDAKGHSVVEGKQFTLKSGSRQGDTVVVYIKPGPDSIPDFTNDKLPDVFKTDGLPMTLVKVNGFWKIDMKTTK